MPTRWVVLLGGASFIADNAIVIFTPQFDLPYILVPMFVAMISWTPSELIKGIDRTKRNVAQV